MSQSTDAPGPRTHIERREVLGLLIAGAAAFRAQSALKNIVGVESAMAATPTPAPCPTPDTSNILSKPMLLTLVADLIRDPGLRSRFVTDPVPVFKERGLDSNVNAMTALYKMSVPVVHAYVTQEATAWLQAFNGFNVTDKIAPQDPVLDQNNCDQNIESDYPDVSPKISKVRWTRKGNGTVVVVAYGQSIARDAQLVLVASGGQEFMAQTIVGGTFRNSQVTGTFNSLAAGDYKIKLVAGTQTCPIIVDDWNSAQCKVAVP